MKKFKVFIASFITSFWENGTEQRFFPDTFYHLFEVPNMLLVKEAFELYKISVFLGSLWVIYNSFEVYPCIVLFHLLHLFHESTYSYPFIIWPVRNTLTFIHLLLLLYSMPMRSTAWCFSRNRVQELLFE